MARRWCFLSSSLSCVPVRRQGQYISQIVSNRGNSIGSDIVESGEPPRKRGKSDRRTRGTAAPLSRRSESPHLTTTTTGCSLPKSLPALPKPPDGIGPKPPSPLPTQQTNSPTLSTRLRNQKRHALLLFAFPDCSQSPLLTGWPPSAATRVTRVNSVTQPERRSTRSVTNCSPTAPDRERIDGLSRGD